ncbi:hypothetical protein EDC96DRAFT_435442 [Choanephora cucurbitarum]|nr:hypothetical protein EDC96DRAFT_435442 [Choanephora cucurbitarum]
MIQFSPFLMKFMSDPTDFSGDIRRTNPINWLKKLDRIKTLGQLNDESILLIAVDHLTEQAGCWYNLTYTGNEDTTWVEFKAAFKAKYCIGQTEVWWDEIHNIKQLSDESIEDVEIRMRELFQLVEVKDERMIKRTFLKAIHSEIALEVERSGIDDKTTLQDLVLKAMKAEKFLRKYKNADKTQNSSTAPSSIPGRDYNPYSHDKYGYQTSTTSVGGDSMSDLIKEFREMKVSLLKATSTNNSGSNQNHKNSQNTSGKRSFACFYCKEEGHRKADCPKLKQALQDGTAQESGKDKARQ